MSYHSPVPALRTRPAAELWMALALCAALFSAAIVLTAKGTGESGTIAALLVTARLAFLCFWPAYAGSALTTLFGPAFKVLKEQGREFGLAFAGVMAVHFGLVAWLCWIGHAPGISVFVIFGIAAAWVFLLATFSIGGLQRALGAWGWWIIRVIGLNYIAYAFLIDFTKDPLGGGAKHLIEYLPFAAFAVAGPIFWVAAQALRMARHTPTGPGAPPRMGASPARSRPRNQR